MSQAVNWMIVCFNASSMFIGRLVVFPVVVCLQAERLVSCLRSPGSWYVGFGHAQPETEYQGRCGVRDVDRKHLMTQLVNFLTAAWLILHRQQQALVKVI